MTRLLIAVEGETEESFVNNVLSSHLLGNGYTVVSARLMGNSRARSNRGGISSWPATKSDIIRHLREDNGRYVGLMADYYALPDNWPGKAASRNGMPWDKSRIIQEALKQDLSSTLNNEMMVDRFVPCIMLHEFETLLFSDPEIFAKSIGMPHVHLQMQSIVDDFNDIELINDSPLTAPSKRIMQLIPHYNKPLFGTIAAIDIGLPKMRDRCQNFGNWVTQLEGKVTP